MKNDYEIRGDITVIFVKSGKYGIKEVLIDTKDLEKVKQFKHSWYVVWSKGNKDFYVNGNIRKPNGKRTNIPLHRWILGITDSEYTVDHINHQTLDNTRKNLNVVKFSENQQNKRPYRTNKSGYSGVVRRESSEKWEVYITANNKKMYLGSFSDINEAIQVRKEAERKYHNYKTKIAGTEDITEKVKELEKAPLD